MSATSGGSSSFVRLSDNEISKILSIPMSLVSENCSQRDQSAQVQSEQAKNPNVNVSSAGSLCDNTQRNLLHLNKVVTYSMFTFVFVFGLFPNWKSCLAENCSFLLILRNSSSATNIFGGSLVWLN